QAKLLADLRHDLETLFPQTLESIGRSARLVRAAAEEARSGSGHALRDCECLLAGFDGAWAGCNAEVASAKTTVSLRKTDDRIFFFYVTAHQLVGLADPDDVLHSCHFVQSARFYSAAVAGDADGSAGCTGNGMGTVAKRLDFFTNRAHLLLSGVRLHHD